MSLLSKIKFRLKHALKPLFEKVYSIYARKKLNDTKFCVICNNCFAGHLYETIKRPYNTPTVGLYFFAEDYIKFIENLEAYLDEDLQFINHSRFGECHEEHQRLKYPIGVLSNNLEIHFLHYGSEEEAKSKWDRRKARVNKDNILIIMNDQNRFFDELMPRFDAIKYPKVFLSAKQRLGKNVKFISYYENREFVGDMYNNKLNSIRDFNLVSWIKKQNS